MPAESSAIAAIQWEYFQSRPELRPLLSADDEAYIVEVWNRAITRPEHAHNRVLVSTVDDGTTLGRVVGFIAFGPSDDPDAELGDADVVDCIVAAEFRRQGHGSRLMHAMADTVAQDGYRRLTWWVNSADDLAHAWLGNAGWALDGAWRLLGDDSLGDQVRIKQVRFHTVLDQESCDCH